MWQAAPTWSTRTSSASPSQSSATDRTCWTWPEVAPLRQYSCAAAGPVGRAAGGQRAAQRLVVHPAEHEHLAGVVLLHDRGDEALGVALEPRGDGRVEDCWGGHPRHSAVRRGTVGATVRWVRSRGHPDMKVLSTSAKRSGSSRWGKCPAPSNSSTRLLGKAWCAVDACQAGIIRSRVPQTTSVGGLTLHGEVVVRRHRLPAGVDDGSRGGEEGAAAVSVTERREAAPRLPHVRRWPPTQAPQGGAEPFEAPTHPPRRDHRQHQLCARERGRAQQRADGAAQPPARHEDEPVDPLREEVAELQGDPAAEGVADQRDRGDVEPVEEVAQCRGVRPERVVPHRLVGGPVPEEVGHDHAVVPCPGR